MDIYTPTIRYFICILTLLIAISDVFAVSNNPYIGYRLSFSTGLRGGIQWRSGVQLGILIQPSNLEEILVPASIHVELFQNGLGSQNANYRLTRNLHHSIIIAGGLQVGNVVDREKRFTDSTFPFSKALNINHQWGMGAGSKWVWLDPFGNAKSQRIGYLNFQFDRVQIQYSNDGAFPLGLPLGDKYDRYWTGGGLLTYEDSETSFQIGFDRFTGFKEGAYEFATMMGYKRVDYGDEQTWYNRGEWHVGFRSKRLHEQLGFLVKIVDFPPFETQDGIHYKGKMALHPTPNAPNFLIGILYEDSYQ